ncbi:hypothetical protein GGTG_11777 [Gaeumannomyces tritici R3-111a-1]|uniref:Isovaleryl-CoA dehydrogenase n=1 Tax=Gaeumannomyces tritici (strain R3-111a-1) TaxID=644352 RepID=J3PE54_GAET3|nr:hypothetical protein GGTG_11777 [Gaeumannomyces tritici R3-111a-1]EJT70754.1 hypothetical protein GGTG_11777 [Gaeumannomyces tritici R3-111a-1]
MASIRAISALARPSTSAARTPALAAALSPTGTSSSVLPPARWRPRSPISPRPAQQRRLQSTSTSTATATSTTAAPPPLDHDKKAAAAAAAPKKSKHPAGFTAPDRAALDELREGVREFCRREIPEELAARIDRDNAFPAGLWPKLGEMGLLGISAEESVGGLAMGYAAHCVAMEELSRASASVALSYAAHSQLCVNQLQLNGTADQKARFMPGLVAGTQVGALAMSESGAGSDVVSMRTRAARSPRGDGWLLNGSKMWITNGPDADVVVVYAKTDPAAVPASRGMTAFIVRRQPGLTCLRKLDKMGMRGSNTGELVLEDVFVPDADVLGSVGGGARVLMEGLDLERLVLSAGPLGIMQAALDVALPYAHARTQFGRPVAEFQLVQGRLADMYTKLQASRAYTYETARRVDETGEIRTQDCAGAILYAAERATEVALDCIQVLGGMGYTEEMPASRLLRDAKLYEIGAGTSEVRRMVIGRYFNKQFATTPV